MSDCILTRYQGAGYFRGFLLTKTKIDLDGLKHSLRINFNIKTRTKKDILDQ